MYAHILLKGYWTHESDSYNSDKEAAMYLLQPMAEAGLPAAQFDIGYYFKREAPVFESDSVAPPPTIPEVE